MRRPISILLAALWLAGPQLCEAATKRVIISFKAKATQVQKAKAVAALGGKQVASIMSNGASDGEFVAVVADVPADKLPARAKAKGDKAMDITASIMSLTPALAKADVIGVEEDFRTKWIEALPSFQGASLPDLAETMASLPKFEYRTAMSGRPELTWGIERVKAPAAWDYTEGAGVRVAVIDTGIDSSHGDLLGKVDGGYDAISKSESKEAWQDQNGHGTHVSGTIAALRDGKGVVGVAPRARLYAVRVLDADGSGSMSDVIDGIIWAANNDIQVANMSLGSSMGSDTLRRALRYAKSRGVVVVAAAGNSGAAVGYPAAYPETIAVAASDASDKLAFFSSRGPEVDFIAPGVYVVSAKMGGGYANFSGTSMATPHVTGLAALAVSQGWVGLDGPDGVMAQLQKAARPLEGLSTEEQGAGLIDASRLTRQDILASR